MKSAIVVLILAANLAAAQQPSGMAEARAIDQESRQLKEAPEDVRGPAVRKLALRIREQPAQFAAALASNLATDNADVSDPGAVQEIADTLVFVLRKAAGQEAAESAYRRLAELSRYYRVQVSMDDPLYLAALRELDREEEQRRSADFTLSDLDGKQWTLSGLRGKVVLVNFWATWCPPCRAELPALKAAYDRFKTQGLVVLAISEEDPGKLRQFATEEKIGFPVLADPGEKARKAFRVTGIPVSFLYDRSGRLVAQVMTVRTVQGFLDTLARAGLGAAVDRPQRAPEIESLIDQARSVPAEFSADVLLRVAASPLGGDPKGKRELIEEAFATAGRAQWPYRRTGGIHTDTRESRAAWDNGLDALSLQLRAVEAMLLLDRQRALAMFQEIRIDGPSGFSCQDALVPSASGYYATLPKIFERAFTPKQREEEDDIAFVERAIRSMTSPAQVVPVAEMFLKLRVSAARRQRLANAFAATLAAVAANYRLFGGEDTDTVEIAWSAYKTGLDMSALMPAMRSYLVRMLAAPRCGHPYREPEAPSFPKPFNDLVERLNAAGADYRPISEEEQRASRDGGTFRVHDYWQSPRSKQVMDELRWLTHGNRNLPDNARFWTLEERSTPEWNSRYLDVMKLIEGWKEDEEPSPADFFHMKANTLYSLAKLIPPGHTRDNALHAWLSFLEQMYASIENRNEWFTEVQSLLPGKSANAAEAKYVLDEMERSGNAVISLYARAEKLLGPR